MKTKKNNLVKKYNMSLIMTRAWALRHKSNNTISLSDCLRQSWHIAKNGINNSTFDEVYNKNYSNVYNYVNFKIKDSEIGKDITQDVFIKLHKHLDNYDVYTAKLTTWLRTITNHAIIDHIRSKANKNSLMNISVNQYTDDDNKEYLQLPDNSTKDDTIENNELLDKLGQAFDNLKPKYKQIGEMYFIQELSYNEIAKTLDIPMGTVKGNLARVRKMLQENLKNMYEYA
ncbi:MAG: RNA polymerase sigma factor [Candidatus Odinarchaeia archaeon]